MTKQASGLARYLRRPEIIRERCHLIFSKVAKDRGKHFSFHSEKLPDLSACVLAEINHNYPDHRIPFHSRFRHFESGGTDRVALLREKLRPTLNPCEWGRLLFEWVVLSVLTDAGAGPAWSFKDPKTGEVTGRSEGLALAGTFWYQSGGLSRDATNPYRIDRIALLEMNEETLAAAFQVSDHNPLAGLGGRAEILRRLGGVLSGKQDRLGCLWDDIWIPAGKKGGEVGAGDILAVILQRLSPVWPDGLLLEGENLGDVGRHEFLMDQAMAPGLVPFHKLSQWLTYSLLEVCEEAGLRVGSTDILTGLPEYRNGGLLLDIGVLRPLEAGILQEQWHPASELVTEWRALTVALMDLLAADLRKKLSLSAKQLPLAKILQGGTWSAGRKIAGELRPGGGPPLKIESTGTIF